MRSMSRRSGNIDKLISVEQSQTEILQRGVRQKLPGQLELLRPGIARQSQLKGSLYLANSLGSGFALQTGRERLDCCCIKSLLNNERLCSECVLTGRTGQDVMVSG
jgi:hypothetical protein